MNLPKFTAFLLLLFWLMGCRAPLTSPEKGPYVILKLDDCWYEDGLVHPGWRQVFDYLNEQHIVATIGIIGERMQDAPPAYYAWLKSQATMGHEIWNHGWCHCKPEVNGRECREFQGTSYAFQLAAIQKTQALARENLGFPLTAFGAPYNATDSATVRALAAVPELTTWMYPHQNASTAKHILPRIAGLNLEIPTHIPNPDSLQRAWESLAVGSVITLQGHPRSWVVKQERFEDFKRIIRFLREKKVRFITPSAYQALVKLQI